MAFARVNGTVVHYRLAGRGGAPALVLVNSLGTDARIWDEVVELLGKDYRVLSYDKRGHGLSGAPVGGYTLDDHIDDLSGLVETVGLGRFALCGVSVGGLIAQGFALRHANRLAGLVLCDTAPRVGDAAFWNGRIATIRESGLEAIADALMERWFSDEYRARHPIEVEGWRTMLIRQPTTGYIGTCITLRDTDLSARIGAIAVPSLVLAGEHDRSTPPALVKECADAIPGARFELVASAGHLPSIDQPGALAEQIRSFLQEIGHG